MTEENMPIPEEDTPIYTQLRKEYAATEKFEEIFTDD